MKHVRCAVNLHAKSPFERTLVPSLDIMHLSQILAIVAGAQRAEVMAEVALVRPALQTGTTAHA